MRQVVVAQQAPFPVFEPLLANLIAADVKLPDFGWHALEKLRLVDPDAAAGRALAGFGVSDLLHPIIARKIFNRFATSVQQGGEAVQTQDISEREMEILRLAARGMSNQDIANNLFLSRRTVQAHLGNIFRKMEVGSRTEAILEALRRGWFTLDNIA